MKGSVRVEVEKKLNNRRLIIILLITLALIVLAFVWLLCVSYDIRKQSGVKFEDFFCSVSDTECLRNLCPETRVWIPEIQECSGAKLDTMGISPNNPATCRVGYLWVP